WQRNGRARRAGISSFGISGTNAHLIVEEAPESKRPSSKPSESGESPSLHGAVPVVISGRDAGALRAQSLRWASWLAAHPEAQLLDVASTAAEHRTHFDVRASVFARSVAEAVSGLTALGEGRPHEAVVEGESKARGKVVFVFPGQGSQWEGMGR